MPKFIVGARLHDYGKGTPDELFAKVSADGFAAVQLAYKKCVPTVKSYADVTNALVADTIAAEKAHSIQVAVLGTYVELAINDESRLQNAADFKSQLAVCKALGAGCIGTETTAMSKQPAGTTREEAQELLCRSLAEILPTAEELGVTVGIEPVTLHSMNCWARKSSPYTSKARRLTPRAACCTRAWKKAAPTTPGPSPCCANCPRPPCRCCAKRPYPPARLATLHL